MLRFLIYAEIPFLQFADLVKILCYLNFRTLVLPILEKTKKRKNGKTKNAHKIKTRNQ